MKKILGLMIVFCLMCSAAAADKITMRDGTIKEGRIVDENTFSYMLRVDEEDVRIFKDQVALVERSKKESKPEPSALLKQLEQEGFVSQDELDSLETLTDEKRKLIIRFLEINGTTQLLEKNKKEALEKVSIEQYGRVSRLLDVEGIMNVVVAIYAKHYTTDELRQTVDFFESEAGQKIINKTPQIMQEVVQASVQYFQKQLQEQKLQL